MPKQLNERVDFSGVRYANCWEDADILCTALNPRPGARMLSIASAGDNALALLAEGAEVVAADLSSAQLACVELRRAAFRELDYEPLLRFLGIHDDDSRLATFDRLKPQLPTEVQAYWQAHPEWIERGISHVGKFERYFHLFRERVLPWVHSRRRVEALVEEKDASGRRTFYDRQWNTWRWRWMFRVFFSRTVMGRLGRDPEFFRYVEGSVADRILARAEYALTELTTHDNPYLDYILFGNYRTALPRYLRRENFDKVREGLDRLMLVDGTIQQAAEQHGDAGFDGFNLSDIFEYLDDQLCEQIFSLLRDKCRPHGRMAYWNMLAPRTRPESLADRWEPRNELASELFARDRAFFYSRFVVEEAI
ncbi:DUF3419 family protein [Aeoliella mucimassa]|uniref:S-adenosylmethionine:diacylglycerol 3-amino-3-carboxypropyl transferase n=1 Tax=Aeoliella mucimassa TaxID=2527972 RepID=A0A518AK57_9BACT|nr:DUF3419 family protein [Aeoliella mucimassa]QDU55103.1 hypothetical protein Pan181_12890 [Aeoliella mucimassa]